MSLELFNFVYNTLMERANDDTPGNQLFLPVALSNAKSSSGSPLLPPHADAWSMNNISGAVDISNDLASSWFNAFYPSLCSLSAAKPSSTVTQQMIDAATAAVTYITSNRLKVVPFPNIGPSLTATDVDINGLANIKVNGTPLDTTSAKTGYTATITLTLNAYSVTDPWCQPLALGGPVPGIDSSSTTSFSGLNFVLTQPLCFATTAGVVTPPPPTLGLPASAAGANAFDCTAQGIALLTLSNALVVGTGSVTVDTTPELLFTLSSLTLQPIQGSQPSFALQYLDYQSIEPLVFPTYFDPSLFYGSWSRFFKNLLSTPDAAAMLSTKINAQLSDPNNMAQIAQMLTGQISNAVDSILDSKLFISGGTSSDVNDVDEYLFNRMRGALNDPTGYLYVPTRILSTGSPVLDPYQATNVTIGDLPPFAPAGQPMQISDVVVSTLVIRGLSNMTAPPQTITFDSTSADPMATASLQLGQVPAGTKVTVNGQSVAVPMPPANGSASFSLNVRVSNYPAIPLGGTVSFSVTNNSGATGAYIKVTASGDTPEELTLTFGQIMLATNVNDMSASVILNPRDPTFEGFLNSFLKQPPIINKIIDALNSYISGELDSISQAATQFAREQLENLGL